MLRWGGRRAAPGGAVLAAGATLLAGSTTLAGQAAPAPRFAASARAEVAVPLAGTRVTGVSVPIGGTQWTRPLSAGTLPTRALLPSAGAPAPVAPRPRPLREVHPSPCIPHPPGARDAWLAEDKARHLFASLALTAVAFGGARAAGIEWPDAGFVAGVVASGAGLAKEVSDRARGRPFSVRDLVWDAAGVGVGLVLAERARR